MTEARGWPRVRRHWPHAAVYRPSHPERARYVLDLRLSRSHRHAGRALPRRRASRAATSIAPIDRGALRAQMRSGRRGRTAVQDGRSRAGLADGTIDFLGRADDQIRSAASGRARRKSRRCCARHPAVGRRVVLARQDGHGDMQLVAYVSLDGRARRPLEARSRRDLRHRLPAYMVPAAFVVLVAPAPPSGKLDRAALPAPPRHARRRRPRRAATPDGRPCREISCDVLEPARSTCTTTSSRSADTRCSQRG